MPDIGDPTLSEQDRKKLDSIVQQMQGNKESDENIQFVVSDFKKKYGNVGGSKPYISPAKTTPETPVLAAYNPTNPAKIDHPVTIKGPTQELSQEQIQKLPTVQQKHDEEVSKAAQNVNATLANIQSTAANVLRHRQTAEKIKADQRAERNAQEMGKPYTPDLNYHVATDEEVKKLAEDPNEHPKLLAAKVDELNAEGKKKDANALKSDTYALISSKNIGNREKQLHNKELIAQGKLDYDMNTHQLVKHVDGIEGAVEAGSQSVRNTVGAVELFKADDEKKAEILNKAFAAHDPDEPVVKIGGVENFVGGQLPMLATGAIPGVGSALMTGQMAAQGYYGGMMETYPKVKAQLLKEKYPDKSEAEINELISKPDAEIDPVAVKKATTVANEHGIIDAITAHFMGKVAGPEIKTKPFSIGAQEAIKLTADASKVAMLFGAGQEAKNLASEQQGIKAEPGSLLNAELQGAMMHAGFFAIAKGGAALKAAGRNLIKHNLSEQPIEEVQKAADNLVEKGLVPKEKADEVVADVLEHKDLNEQIPAKVKNEEVRVDLTKKIKRRQELEEELKQVNKAFHPEIKEKIATLDEKITEQANSPEAKKPAEKAVDESIAEKPEAKLEIENEAVKPVLEKTEPIVEKPAVKETLTAEKPIAEKGNVTKEADDLLSSLDSGSKPAFVTKQLEKIAKDNGIDVTDKSTPDQIIEQLKNKKDGKTDKVPEKQLETPVSTEKPVHEEAIAAAKEHMKPEMATAFAEDPEGGLKEAAQQLNASPSEAKTARAFYGDKLSDLALKAFPDEKAPELSNKTKATKLDQPGEKITSKEALQKELDIVKSSYPQYAKKYPGITQDEYNVQRMAAYNKQVAARTPLPKFGEKTEGGAIQEHDVHKILKDVAEDENATPVEKKAVDMIQKAAEKIPGIKIDKDADFSSGEYKGHKIDPQAKGYSFADGTIIINTDAHTTQAELRNTVVHEVMHAITRHGIDTNEALKTDLRDVLTDVRKALKVPDFDALIPELVKRGIIDENKYGTANEHELIAEVFSNQKFYDMLKGLEYKGDNLLKRAYIAIAKYFSENYKALAGAKSEIKTDNIADYLMQLTEKTLRPGTGEGEALGLDKGSAEEKEIKRILYRTDLPEADIKDALVNAGHDVATVDRLMAEVKEERDLGPEEIVKRALEIGKQTREQAKKNPIVDPSALKPASIIKSFKRNFMDTVDEVTDLKGIIRSRKGEEEQAITQLYKASNGLRDMWNKVPKEKQLAFILGMERPDLVKNQPQELQDAAKLYRDRLDAVHEQIKSSMPNINFIEDYFPHFWKKPEQAANIFQKMQAKKPMEGSKSFAKARFFDSIKEGIEAGLEMATTNPEEMVRLAEANAWKFKSARNIFEDMKNLGYLKYSTAADVPKDWKGVDDKLFNRMGAFITKEGDAQATTGKYLMPPEMADLMNNYLSLGLKGNVKDFISGFNNVKNNFQLGAGLFHFTTTSVESLINGNTVGLQKLSTLKPKLMLEGLGDMASTAAIIPNLYKTFSRGHRAIKDYEAGNMTDDVQALMNANARVGRQKMYSLDSWYNAKKAFGEIKANKDFSKIPKFAWNVLMTAPEALNKPLMEHWVPALKVGGYLRSLKSEIETRPNMTPRELQQAKEKIWDSMDDRLGQVVYDNVFVNKKYKDLAFMAIRSAGWTGGTIRTGIKGVAEIPLSGKRLIKGEGLSQRTADMFSMFLTVGGFGGALHYMMTGSPPDKMEDYFFPKDGTKNPDGIDRRITLPSYVKDYLAYAKSPGTTISHKLSPILNDAVELWNNKDFYGEQVYDPEDPIFQKGLDVINQQARSMIPFSFKENKQTSAPNKQQKAEQFVGLTEAPKERERSETQNAIMKAYVTQMGTNADGVSHEAMEQRIARRHLTESLFNGEKWEDLDEDIKKKANIKPDKLEEFKKKALIDPFINRFKGLKKEVKQQLLDEMPEEDYEKYKQYVPEEK